MNAYNEIKIGNHSVFEKVVLDEEGSVVSKRRVDIPLFQVKRGDFTYLVLYDDDMRVIRDAFDYLNHTISGSPLNTRLKKASVLRFLYCFLSLSNVPIDGISDADLTEYELFLRGIGNVQDRFDLKTQRSAATINGHFAAIRDYFTKCGTECDALFRSRSVTVESPVGLDYSARIERKRYTSNLRNGNTYERSIPKFISPEEFGRLYGLALQKGDRLALVMMRIMYLYGLRLGEVLGLTMEDVTEKMIDGKLTPVLIVRNRVTDEPFQSAKGLYHPKDRSEYRMSDYSDSKWVIPISYETYEMVLDYIEDEHSRAMRLHPDNYASGEADVVSRRNAPESNHYVFLNRYGRVLSGQTWGNALKGYFREAGIPLDHESRSNNLSHRFRHGFAMYHAWFSKHPVGVLELQDMMRHSSLSSTMVYFNPTVEDQVRTKAEFQAELYEMIPALKGEFLGC